MVTHRDQHHSRMPMVAKCQGHDRRNRIGTAMSEVTGSSRTSSHPPEPEPGAPAGGRPCRQGSSSSGERSFQERSREAGQGRRRRSAHRVQEWLGRTWRLKGMIAGGRKARRGEAFLPCRERRRGVPPFFGLAGNRLADGAPAGDDLIAFKAHGENCPQRAG